jgi:hypothetical protein
VSLGSEVHDGIDLLGLKHEVHQVRTADVTFNELVVRIFFKTIQVLQYIGVTNNIGVILT